MEKVFVKRISTYKNPKTGKERKQLVFPQKINDMVTPMCTMIVDEESKEAYIKFW